MQFNNGQPVESAWEIKSVAKTGIWTELPWKYDKGAWVNAL